MGHRSSKRHTEPRRARQRVHCAHGRLGVRGVFRFGTISDRWRVAGWLGLPRRFDRGRLRRGFFANLAVHQDGEGDGHCIGQGGARGSWHFKRTQTALSSMGANLGPIVFTHALDADFERE